MSAGADCLGRHRLADVEATERFAGEMALLIQPGDLIALSGELGAGKTTFARALIRALARDSALEVPSPTFSLVQEYDETRVRVLHCDLYRLASPRDIDELGLVEALEDSAVLVEWPENAGDALPRDRLTITLRETASGREAVLSSPSQVWRQRLARMQALARFLETAGWSGCVRSHLQGDASARRYERVRLGDRVAIVMDSPARPDPGRPGAPSYSAVAHLAENVEAFVAVASALRGAGARAPEIYAHDLDAGFLLLEDLGSGTIVSAATPPAPIAERYRESARLLAHLHAQPLARTLPVPGGGEYRVPDFDAGVVAAETALLLDWYWPHVHRGEECPGRHARGVPGRLARGSGGRRNAATRTDLGAARLSFAQHRVVRRRRGARASAGRAARQRRRHRFPGRVVGTGGL